jgi:ADP-ribose pyrophosphatase YjhB (NUDIX family)
MKFCSACGGALERKIPAGDHLPRQVCIACATVHYQNPKAIVGCVPEWTDGRILMCKRGIEPRLGLWTFPAGFMELNETGGQGAAREALEESGADVEITDLMAVIDVPYVSQVYLIYRARLLADRFYPTPESSEVVLMREDEIPWTQIAFPTIWHSLKFFYGDRASNRREIHTLELSFKPRPPQRAEVSTATREPV